MSVQSKMTAIASPIRTLTGATGKLSLDQMATQLTDANTAKSAILAALTEKGVTTTGSEGIGEIAALVESIEAGGGMPVLAYGTTTPAENQADDIEIDTGLDDVPNDARVLIIRMPSSANTEAPAGTLLYTWNYGKSVPPSKHGVGRYVAGSYGADTSYDINNVRGGIVTLSGSLGGNYAYGLAAGEEYLWIVM